MVYGKTGTLLPAVQPRRRKKAIPFVHRFWSNPLAWGLAIYAGCTTVMALVYLIFLR